MEAVADEPGEEEDQEEGGPVTEEEGEDGVCYHGVCLVSLFGCVCVGCCVIQDG